MKNYCKLFLVFPMIVFLIGCSVIRPVNKISGGIKESSEKISATSTNNISPGKITVSDGTEIDTKKSSTTLAQVIAALDGQHLKDLYRELSVSSAPVDWEAIAASFGQKVDTVKSAMPSDPADIDWHVIGSIELATSSIDCESAAKSVYSQFELDKNIAAAPLISVGDTKDDFDNNVSDSLALKKYEECWLQYFPRAQKLGLPAKAAFYEELALTLGSEFTVGAAVLYNISEHQDWCSLPRLNEEKKSYCLGLKAADVIPKMREYYQITDAITEIKKQYADYYAKTGDASIADQYGDEEDSDSYAQKKLAVMGAYLRTVRSQEAAMSRGSTTFDNEYFNGKVRITVVSLREDQGWMGILDNLNKK
jgi:hypothetical protein